MPNKPKPDWVIPLGMDIECVPICKAMNKVPGILTVESCCGHGKTPFHIWFEAKSLTALPALLYWFNSCHCGFSGWSVQVTTDCGCSSVTFMVEGPVGAYKEANHIAKLIEEDNP